MPAKKSKRVPSKQYEKRASYKKAHYAYNKTRRANVEGEKIAAKEREPGMISKGGNALGAAIGTAFGPAGTAIGSFLGGKLGHLIETITGFGDYSIEQNSIMKGGMSPPQIVNSTQKGGVIVRHREYLRDIQPTDVFTPLSFPLNPGQGDTFPWLSRMASLFDQYRFRGIIFEYKSTSSDAILSSSTSSALGSVSMATEYDTLDANYSSKREMLNSMFANSTKPSCSFIHPIECKTSLSPLRLQYVRTTNGFPPGGDPRMYDLGKMIFATEGQQNVSATSGSIGELWVTYECEFFKQQLPVDVSHTDHFKITAATAPGWLGPADNLHPGDPENSIGGTINTAGSTYRFPTTISNGIYKIDYYVLGTTAVVGAKNIALVGCTEVDLGVFAVPYTQSPASGVNSISLYVSFIVQVNAPSASITFNSSVIPTAGQSDFWVMQIDSDLTDF